MKPVINIVTESTALDTYIQDALGHRGYTFKKRADIAIIELSKYKRTKLPVAKLLIGIVNLDASQTFESEAHSFDYFIKKPVYADDLTIIFPHQKRSCFNTRPFCG
jgi:hypothetical protein